MMMSPDTLRPIVEGFCGVRIDPQNNTSRCPFAGTLHDAGTERDVLWTWDATTGKPHARCFHAKCAHAWDELMRDLYHHLNALQRAERAEGSTPAGDGKPRKAALPLPPKERPQRALPCDHALAAYYASQNPLPEVTEEMLLAASPIPIPADPAEHGALLIDTLYREGEHVLVFTTFTSQGQYLRTARTGKTYRLSNKPGVQALPSPRLPAAGNEGVWFLAAPVLGTWQPNPNKKDAEGNLLPGRRHTQCCTRFPYLVLESDEIAPATWLRSLTQLAEPIAAIYTSGGKSIHALVAVNCRTAEEFNAKRAAYIRRLSPIGADPAAITAVRLTRLPGCLRLGAKDATGTYRKHEQPRLQRLLYLNPTPTAEPLYRSLTPPSLSHE